MLLVYQTIADKIGSTSGTSSEVVEIGMGRGLDFDAIYQDHRKISYVLSCTSNQSLGSISLVIL